MSALKRRALAGVLVGLAALAFLLRAELAFLIANQRPDVEGARLAVELEIEGHEVLAEIGAGSGHHTVAIARRLPRGRMYSTELDESGLQDIRQAVADAGLSNVDIRQAELHATGLPDACCDAVFMRTVYHHFQDPSAMLDSLHATLKPSGLLAIIELEPRGLWHVIGSPPDTPDRGGHGISKDALVQEVTGSRRFSLERVVEDWIGPLYLAVFRRAV
jgi:ubiquinone/menaquinone biosynthesis C-methylase UbiE